MGYIISLLSQKGGVGKSTLSQLIATEFARMDSDDQGNGGWSVKIADLDIGQATSLHWVKRRQERNVKPEVRAETYRIDKALKDAEQFEVMVIDGAPSADIDTKKAAKASDLIVLPSGLSEADMRATVNLAHELKAAGIDMNRVVIVLMRTGKSEFEERLSRDYFTKAGYPPIEGCLSEQTGYRYAMDNGHAVSETKIKSLNAKAQALFAAIIAPLGQAEPTTEEHAA